MQKHQFSVGLLTELPPHVQQTGEGEGRLLGLNVNKGQAIKLRLRTDAYDGFRLYKDVRRTLCHELTHNVWGDHDDNVRLEFHLAPLERLTLQQFKELNSRLNKEVAEYERSAQEGTHSLTGIIGPVYEPSSELEAEAHVHILGGSAMPRAGEGREERRQRMLDATMGRLRKEEEELESSCGTAGPAAEATRTD